jgi:hypothetical protein
MLTLEVEHAPGLFTRNERISYQPAAHARVRKGCTVPEALSDRVQSWRHAPSTMTPVSAAWSTCKGGTYIVIVGAGSASEMAAKMANFVL